MAIQTTNSTSSEANVDPIDSIADLLTTGITEDSEESNDQTEESTEVKESEAEGNETEEETEEDETEEESDEETEESEEAEESESEDGSWGDALGIDDANVVLDDEGNFAGIITKVDGETSTVLMKDLVTGYQSNKFNTHKSQSLSEDRKQFEADKQELSGTYRNKLENVEVLANYLSSKLSSDFEGVNWQQLRVEDPAEYAAKRQDMSQKAQELQQMQAAINSEKSEGEKARATAQQGAHTEYLNQEFGKMLVNNPDWNDNKVYKSAMTEMQTFLTDSYGFNADDFNSVQDSRLFELTKDAMAYRKGITKAEVKLKKPVPKFQKAKVTTSKKRVSKLDKLTKVAKSSRGANQREAQRDAIAELIS